MNSEVWTGFSKNTHTMKQMGRSMIHFEKLQESSIITLPQLLAGLANKVVKTFCFSVSSLLLLPLPPTPPPHLH